MRTRHIHFRASNEEFERIQNQARTAKLSTAEYVRNKALDRTLNADDLRQIQFALSNLATSYNHMANSKEKETIGMNINQVIEALNNLYRMVGR